VQPPGPPPLAITTSAINGLGLGPATTLTLVATNDRLLIRN
jgi:Na+-translocating ferredoxin:NAD+ oxidoreductase RnfE subunit